MEEITLILKDILECTTLQKEALNTHDIDTFKELVDKRDTYIQLLKKVREKALELTPVDMELVQTINRLDALNTNSLKEEMEVVKNQLKEVRQSKRRDNKYMDPYHNLGTGRNFVK